ncbi:phospholipid scramblase 2-like isoform X3 [Phyllobates terribilis]
MQNTEQKNLHGKNEPVQSQPRSGGTVSPWTPAPMPSSSQGLEYLRQESQMLVQLIPKFMFVCKRIEYEIQNSVGQQVYTVTEDYNCPYQYFCLEYKSFTRKIFDNTGGLVMEVYKPFESPIFPYCQTTKVEVRTASGEPMAYIVIKHPLCTTTIRILNENSEEVLEITEDLMITFVQDKSEVGRIVWSSWDGMCKIQRNFHAHFSSDLDVKLKAAILAACLLFSV